MERIKQMWQTYSCGFLGSVSCKHPWLQCYIISWRMFTACRRVLRATAKQNGLEHKISVRRPEHNTRQRIKQIKYGMQIIQLFFSEGSYCSLTSRAHTQPLCVAAGHWVFWSELSLHCDRRSHHHLPHLQCGLLFYSPAPKHTQGFTKWDGFKGHWSLREHILNQQHKPWAWRRDRIVGLSGCSRGKDQCHAIFALPQCQDTQPPLGDIYTGSTPYTGMPAVSQTTCTFSPLF